MKKLTKLFSIVLVIAMLVMCMAGCGDKKETAGSDQNPTAGGDASTIRIPLAIPRARSTHTAS